MSTTSIAKSGKARNSMLPNHCRYPSGARTAGENEMRAQPRADDAGERLEAVLGSRGDERHLPGRGELEVERSQQMGHRLRMLGADLPEQPQDRGGPLLVGALARQPGEP